MARIAGKLRARHLWTSKVIDDTYNMITNADSNMQVMRNLLDYSEHRGIIDPSKRRDYDSACSYHLLFHRDAFDLEDRIEFMHVLRYSILTRDETIKEMEDTLLHAFLSYRRDLRGDNPYEDKDKARVHHLNEFIRSLMDKGYESSKQADALNTLVIHTAQLKTYEALDRFYRENRAKYGASYGYAPIYAFLLAEILVHEKYPILIHHRDAYREKVFKTAQEVLETDISERCKKKYSRLQQAYKKKFWLGKQEICGSGFLPALQRFRKQVLEEQDRLPLYGHQRASKAYFLATVGEASYREGLIYPERDCLQKLLDLLQKNMLAESKESRELLRHHGRKDFNCITLGAGSSVLELANFVIPYINLFDVAYVTMVCIDNGKHDLRYSTLKDVVVGQSLINRDCEDRRFFLPENSRVRPFLIDSISYRSADILNPKEVNIVVDSALKSSRSWSTNMFLLLGRTLGMFEDERRVLESIYDVMRIGDELVISVSTVKKNRAGKKDYDSMIKPYLSTGEAEFITELAWVAGWKDVTYKRTYLDARTQDNPGDIDRLVWSVQGKCPYLGDDAVDQQVTISKRYLVGRKVNQLDDIIRSTRMRDADIHYIGADESEKTGVVVAYIRKTPKAALKQEVRKAKRRVAGG